jgi:Holliday junction resolvase
MRFYRVVTAIIARLMRFYRVVTATIALLMRFYRVRWRFHDKHEHNGKNVKDMQTNSHFTMTDVRQQVWSSRYTKMQTLYISF